LGKTGTGGGTLDNPNRFYLVSAVDSVRDAFALFDDEDCVVMVNSTARQLLGTAVGGAIVGMKFEALLDQALRAGVFDFSNESREALYGRWLAYHRSPSGVLDVRTGTGRYLRVTELKTAEQDTVSTIADVSEPLTRSRRWPSARGSRSRDPRRSSCHACSRIALGSRRSS
jgi:PAS domain-containing protein